MHSTQNERINQITSSTLIVGVDIAKFKHVARAQDSRGVEFGKPITFENNREGFELFVSWFQKISSEQGFQEVIVGMEPTGHYWLNLAHFLRDKQVTYGVVNPLHVKKSKELDDNSPMKNDIKDAKVIAQLVKDGRYAIPSLPQGIYAELREAMKIREHLTTDLCVVQARVHNWLDRYFPEFLTVFKQHQTIIKSKTDRVEDQKYVFVVCHKEDDRIIGNIGLSFVVRGPLQSCMIGYSLDQAYNGKGYMTEAVKQVVRYAFEELKFHRIVGEASPRNPGSIRVLENAGFHKEGISRSNVKINGVWEDHQVLALINPSGDI